MSFDYSYSSDSHGLNIRTSVRARFGFINKKKQKSCIETHIDISYLTSLSLLLVVRRRETRAGFHLPNVIADKLGSPSMPEHQEDWETVIST